MFNLDQLQDKFMAKIDLPELPERPIVTTGSGFGQILVNVTLGAAGVEATKGMLSELSKVTVCKVGIDEDEEGDALYDSPRINVAEENVGQQIAAASYEAQGLDCQSVDLKGLIKGLEGVVNWTSCRVIRKDTGRKSMLVLRIVGWVPSVRPVADSDEAREASTVATAAVRWAVDQFVWKTVRTYVNPHFVRPNEPEMGKHNISLEVRAPIARYDEMGAVRTVWTGPKIEEPVRKDGAITYGRDGQPLTRKTNNGRASGPLVPEATMSVADGVITLTLTK